MVVRRATRLAVLLALISALVSVPAFAQTSPGTIKGTVVDKDGNPLPGATVTLENPSMGVAAMGGVTNAQGEFRITPVPPGKGYVLRAAMPSYQKIDFKDIEIPAGRTILQNITLRPEYREIVTVEGKGETVDTETTKISTKISAAFISGLPILGQDYQDILTLAPGVTDVNKTGNPNIHGGRDVDTVTLVDGVSTTDPFSGGFGQNLNAESIEEIEIITSGASAQFSRAQGGFINITTKSGGNEFKGTFTFEMRTSKLDGDGAGIDKADLRGGIGETDGFRDQAFTTFAPFFSVSGAFVKDHLWYYFAPEYIQEETPINAGTQAYIQTTNSARVTGKVTWQVASNNKLVFLGIWDDEKDYNLGLNSQTEQDAAFTTGRGGPTLTIQDNAIFTPNLSLESTISRFDQKFFTEPAINPDTNGNGILTVDSQKQLGGNDNGFNNLRERDPGEDLDSDGKFDVFEDFNGNGELDCVKDAAGKLICPEDLDKDGRLTPTFGCEGSGREDTDCNGRIDKEDSNNNGILDAGEDVGIPCSNPNICPGGVIPETAGNGALDTEDKNRNGSVDDAPTLVAGQSSPLPPDLQYVTSSNTNRTSGPYFRNNSDSRTRNSLKEDLSYYIPDLLGSHDLRMGFSFEDEGYQAETVARPTWQISTGIDLATQRIGGRIGANLPTQEKVSNSAGSQTLGFYVHDTYKPLPNLTLSLGVRFDREEVNSHGYEFFDPALQRQEYDLIQGLKGVESGADLNKDGYVTLSLTSDPLYGPNNTHVLTLNSDLARLSITRLTRHNFETAIESEKLKELGIDDPNLLVNGHPRQPQDFTITNNNLAPRISISWDPWADGKSKATAGWNRFYDKLFLRTVIGEEGPDLLNPYYSYDADGVDFLGLPNNKVGRSISKSPPSGGQVDRSLRTPFTDEVTVGFQREVAPEVSISINYIRRKFRDQLQDVDVNHTVRKPRGSITCNKTPPGGGDFCDDFGLTVVFPSTGGGDAGKKGPDQRNSDQYPDLYINNFNFNQILRVGNYNYQEYTGYELSISRRLSRKWQMDANYTFSKSAGQAESFLSESGDDPAVTELKTGSLDFDQRHVAKLFALAYLPGDWQFGGGITWASGLPYSYINRFQSSDNVDFFQTRRLFGSIDLNNGLFVEENRNIHRNKSVYNIDVKTEKRFVMGKITSAAFFEVFNLLNTDDLRITTIDTGFETLQANETRSFGRRFKVGISMDF